MMGFQSGDSWIFRYNKTLNNLVCIFKQKENEHDDQLNTIDCIPTSGLLISGS